MPPSTFQTMYRPGPQRSPLLVLLLFTLLSGLAGAAVSSERPEIFPNREEIVLEDGQPLNLTCRASQPVAWCSNHQFTTEEYEELYDEGHEKPYISILTIKMVNVSHIGYYSCVFNTTENKEQASCNISDPSISSIYLFVKDLKNLLVHGFAIFTYGFVGESVVVPCKPTFPEVKVTLTRNDRLTPCTEGCVYDEREGFTITLPDTAQLEIFTCEGTYEKASNLSTLFVQINLRNTPVTTPSITVEDVWQEDMRDEENFTALPVYVEEGSDVNLTCTSNDNKVSTGYTLEWTNNSHINESGTHRILRFNEANSISRVYEIYDARIRDSGVYTCWVKVHGELKANAKLNLTVIPKNAAYISHTCYYPNVTELAVKVMWEVNFIVYPEPNFKWFKDGKLVAEHPKSRGERMRHEMVWERQGATLMLNLHDPVLRDNGEHTVVATLNGTNISEVITLNLLIPAKPQKVQIHVSKNMFREKDKFSLACSAEGFPKPNITLRFTPYKDSGFSGDDATVGLHVYNKVVNATEGKRNSVVEREMVWMGVAEQPGWYTCEAQNENGSANSTNKPFLLTDGEADSTLSLELLVDGEMRGGGESNVPVKLVEGDNVTLTCRANKQLATPPLTWRLDGTALTEKAMERWGMHKLENETRLSLLSTVRASSLRYGASNVTLTCSNNDNHTSLTFFVREMKKPTWKGGKPPQKEYDRTRNNNLTLSCPVDGTPTPKVVWKKNDEIQKDNGKGRVKFINNNQQLEFTFLITKDQGRYTCEASNRAGNISATFDLLVRDPDSLRIVIILVFVFVLMAALLVLSIVFCRKIYQARKETLNLQLKDQRMFIEGDPTNINPELPLEEQAELLPYNTKYEVSRDSIIFEKLLGAGAFGRVYKAKALNLLPGEASTTVAVKMMKSRTDNAQLKALRSEVKIMIHIGRHINIVNLLGACSKDLASKGELLLLVEYCRHGNILDYMRRHRKEFVNQINDEDKIDPGFSAEPRPRLRSDSSSRSHGSRGLKYAHLNFHQDNVFYGHDQTQDALTPSPTTLMPPPRFNGEAGGGGRHFRARTSSASSSTPQIASDNSVIPPSETSAGTSDGYLTTQSLMGPPAPLCSMDILAWAYQIAKGMEYLAFKKVLHGDLAARNVLLAENNVVKISDFGLAKDIYKSDNYKKRSSVPVPVKWLAVECLRDGVFSTQSDVWSFGVVLWEIFSLGQIPYSCCNEFNETFISKLENGTRLEQPRYATYGLYRVMLECWNNDPMQRPSFTNLEASLGDMLGEAQRQNYLQLTEPYQQDNTCSEYLDLLPSQDYCNKVRDTSPRLTEDGYEMPFSPGMAPLTTVTGDSQPSPSRLTTRQMEFLQIAAPEDSRSDYMAMSADRKDDRTVFDFDNQTVACLMGRQDQLESNDGDMYLKMDKLTPQPSPAPDTPDGTYSKGKEPSPPRQALKSDSSQGGGRHRAVTKHDSGLYSPSAITSQTNPGYMKMLSFEDHNYVNNKIPEANGQPYANISPAPLKASDYHNDVKNVNEYTNLLPQYSGRTRSFSESSSGVGSLEEESPPRLRGGSVRKAPPIMEEAVAV